MLKYIFEKMIQQDPDEKHRYVFINDNMEIMQNVVAIGYSTLWLTEAEKNAFSLDGFKEYIKSIINTGTNLMDYVFVPACFRKKTNDELEVFFKSNGKWEMYKRLRCGYRRGSDGYRGYICHRWDCFCI